MASQIRKLHARRPSGRKQSADAPKGDSPRLAPPDSPSPRPLLSVSPPPPQSPLSDSGGKSSSSLKPEPLESQSNSLVASAFGQLQTYCEDPLQAELMATTELDLVDNEHILLSAPSVAFWLGRCPGGDAVRVGTLHLTNFALRFVFFIRLGDNEQNEACHQTFPLAALRQLRFRRRRDGVRFAVVASRCFAHATFMFASVDALRQYKPFKREMQARSVMVWPINTFALDSSTTATLEHDQSDAAPSVATKVVRKSRTPVASDDVERALSEVLVGNPAPTLFHYLFNRLVPLSIGESEFVAAGEFRTDGLAPYLVWVSDLYPGAGLLEAASLRAESPAIAARLLLPGNNLDALHLRRFADTFSRFAAQQSTAAQQSAHSHPLTSSSPPAISSGHPSSDQSSSSSQTAGPSSLSVSHPAAASSSPPAPSSLRNYEVMVFETTLDQQEAGPHAVELNLYSELEVRRALLDLQSVVTTQFSPLTSPSVSAAWLGEYGRSSWAGIVRATLSAAFLVSNAVSLGNLALVSGGDMRFVVLSLALVILEPRFRTCVGLCQVVHRHWTQAGYQFRADLAHLPKSHKGHQWEHVDTCSALFVLFLDCLHQLTDCLPDQFEFVSSYLCDLLALVNSCQFATFLPAMTPSAAVAAAITPSLSSSPLSSSSLAAALPGGAASAVAASGGGTAQQLYATGWQALLAGKSRHINPVYSTSDAAKKKLSSAHFFTQDMTIKPWNQYFLQHAAFESSTRFHFLARHSMHPANVDLSGACATTMLAANELSCAEVFDLRLCCNLFTSLPSTVWSCPQLVRLSLSGNACIDSLHPNLCAIGARLPSLTFLDLSHCSLRSVPAVHGFPQLHSLYLHNNHIDVAVLRLDLLPHLSVLKLHNNPLSELCLLPDDAQLLGRSPLTSLNLSNCHIVGSPPLPVACLLNLLDLDLSHNAIASLPVQFGRLSSLLSLRLAHCRFTELPPVIFLFKQLNCLDLRSNQLSTLPASVGKLDVKRLLVEGNPFVDLPPRLADADRTAELLAYFQGILQGQLEEADAVDEELTAASRPIGMERRIVQVEKRALTHKVIFSFLAANRAVPVLAMSHPEPLLRLHYDDYMAELAPGGDGQLVVEPNLLSCASTSTYPDDPVVKTRMGDPICDSHCAAVFADRVVACLTDGCNWGPRPREAAAVAARSFVDSVVASLDTLADASHAAYLLLRACTEANEAIVRGKITEGNMWYESGSCTIIGGLLFRIGDAVAASTDLAASSATTAGSEHADGKQKAPGDQRSSVRSMYTRSFSAGAIDGLSAAPRKASKERWAFICVSIGDCKAFHYSVRRQEWLDITRGNRQDLKNPSDPGGRLGPYLHGGRPDLRNLRLDYCDVEDDDYLVLVSDGIHDNLDLTNMGRVEIDESQPADIFYGRSTWLGLSDVELAVAKDRFLINLLSRLFPDPARLTCQYIARTLIQYTCRFTQRQREFMEQDHRMKQPEDATSYPGKLDHCSILCFRAGSFHPAVVEQIRTTTEPFTRAQLEDPDAVALSLPIPTPLSSSAAAASTSSPSASRKCELLSPAKSPKGGRKRGDSVRDQQRTRSPSIVKSFFLGAGKNDKKQDQDQDTN